MESRITRILEDEFKDIKVMIEELADGRVTGSVVWAGFGEMDDVERQKRLRSVLREKLGAEVQMVGVLLAYTPDEILDMNAA